MSVDVLHQLHRCVCGSEAARTTQSFLYVGLAVQTSPFMMELSLSKSYGGQLAVIDMAFPDKALLAKTMRKVCSLCASSLVVGYALSAAFRDPRLSSDNLYAHLAWFQIFS